MKKSLNSLFLSTLLILILLPHRGSGSEIQADGVGFILLSPDRGFVGNNEVKETFQHEETEGIKKDLRRLAEAIREELYFKEIEIALLYSGAAPDAVLEKGARL